MTTQNRITSEEQRFEYDKLREEILHNSTIILQIQGVTLLITGAIIGVAFSQAISQRPARGLLLYSAIFVSYVGFIQGMDHAKGIFIIASYLRTFIEDDSTHLKWETRLMDFRKTNPEYGHHRVLSMHLTYVVIAWISWIAGTIYFVRELRQDSQGWSDLLHLGYYVLITITGTAVVLLTYSANNQYNKFIKNYAQTFGGIWEGIKNPKPKENEPEGTTS